MRSVLIFFFCCALLAGEPISIELRDQFDHPQKLSFPAEQIAILTIADRKGNEQVDDWINALKQRYTGRVDFKGIAQVAGVPSFLQGHIRKRFQDSRKYPVMMDWTGGVCAKLSAKPGVANVLIFSRSGELLGRFEGRVGTEAVAAASALLDRALNE